VATEGRPEKTNVVMGVMSLYSPFLVLGQVMMRMGTWETIFDEVRVEQKDE
jgi:hypothetical protein